MAGKPSKIDDCKIKDTILYCGITLAVIILLRIQQ